MLTKIKNLNFLLICLLVLLSFIGAATLMDRILMFICVLTFVLFFYDTIKLNFKQKKRLHSHRKQSVEKGEEMHICSQCAKSDVSNPELEFRYRNEEGKAVCYCNLCRS